MRVIKAQGPKRLEVMEKELETLDAKFKEIERPSKHRRQILKQKEAEGEEMNLRQVLDRVAAKLDRDPADMPDYFTILHNAYCRTAKALFQTKAKRFKEWGIPETIVDLIKEVISEASPEYKTSEKKIEPK